MEEKTIANKNNDRINFFMMLLVFIVSVVSIVSIVSIACPDFYRGPAPKYIGVSAIMPFYKESGDQKTNVLKV
jgi:hypothetical protein